MSVCVTLYHKVCGRIQTQFLLENVITSQYSLIMNNTRRGEAQREGNSPKKDDNDSAAIHVKWSFQLRWAAVSTQHGLKMQECSVSDTSVTDSKHRRLSRAELLHTWVFYAVFRDNQTLTLMLWCPTFSTQKNWSGINEIIRLISRVSNVNYCWDVGLDSG